MLRSARQAVFDLYPATLHLNIASQNRQRGIGTALLQRALFALHEEAVTGGHVCVTSQAGKNFFTKAGFSVLTVFRLKPVYTASTAYLESWVLGKRIVGD